MTGKKRSYDEMEEDELRELLEEKDEQLDKLKKKVAQLTKQLKAGGDDEHEEKENTPAKAEDYTAQAEKWRKSIRSAIEKQMSWKPSLKHSTARASHDLPNLPLAAVEAILGPKALAKASKGPKQISVTLNDDEVCELLGGISKSIRYSTLILASGLKFLYNKKKTLRVSGSYGLSKVIYAREERKEAKANAGATSPTFPPFLLGL